jgi:hypothetical protein
LLQGLGSAKQGLDRLLHLFLALLGDGELLFACGIRIAHGVPLSLLSDGCRIPACAGVSTRPL